MKKLILFLLFPFVLSSQETSYICAGQTKTLTINVTSGTAPYTYQWTNPIGNVSSTQTVTANTAGVYLWQFTDVNGCQFTGTHSIIYESDPTGSIVINAVNKCINTNQVVSATGVPAGYSYSWNFGSGSSPGTSTTPTTSILYTTAGTKTISLTISKTFTGSSNGCNATCSWTKTKDILIGELSGNSSCN